MDEDEISLKDYINILKKEKLLILLIFLAAIIAAAVFSIFSPNEYSSEAKLLYIPNQRLSLNDVVEMLNSQATVQKTMPSQKVVSSAIEDMNVENIKNTNQVRIQLKGYDPGMMNKYFNDYIKSSIDEIDTELFIKSNSETLKLNNLESFYTNQKKEINAKMKTILVQDADFEIKRLENLSDTVARLGSRDKQIELEFTISELNSIKEGKISGNMARDLIISDPELSLLNSQLKAIDTKFLDIEAQRLDLQGSMLDLGTNETHAIEKLTSPSNPSVIGPKRSLNIEIAAVLGLFIGVFGAFFKNYMDESH